MNRTIISLAILLLIGLHSFAQTKGAKPADPMAPTMSFDKLEYEYGTLYQNADGECYFAYSNKGKSPLILSRVRSSCGCTIPRWSRMPLNPGQSDTIRVRYDTKRLGSFHKSITILSNAGSGSIVLKIKGKVLPEPIDAMPTKNVDFETSPVNK